MVVLLFDGGDSVMCTDGYNHRTGMTRSTGVVYRVDLSCFIFDENAHWIVTS